MRGYWITWAVLLVFTVVMLWADTASIPRLAFVVFMLAAMLTKASIIGANFMHLRSERVGLILTVVVGLLVTGDHPLRAHRAGRDPDSPDGGGTWRPIGAARRSSRSATVVLVLTADAAFAQCAMCRRALQSPEGQQMVAAFQNGILFLLAAPFAPSAPSPRLPSARSGAVPADRRSGLRP